MEEVNTPFNMDKHNRGFRILNEDELMQSLLTENDWDIKDEDADFEES